jgi:prepilin-type N-terminal cleavage/methylation domain-containing protein
MFEVKNQQSEINNRKPILAFTLVELLVVIAVIALLLSILMPSLRAVRVMAQRVGCAHNLKQIALGVDMYLGDNDHTYPCTTDPVSQNPTYWLWMGRGWRGWIKPYLGGDINVRNPSVLLCPEDRADPAMYESTSYAYSMAFYHSPEQINAITDKAETYSNPKPSVPQHVDSVTTPSAKILIGEWASNHASVVEEKGWWNWQGARNFLFPDGHTSFLAATQINPARDGLPDANVTINGIKGQDCGQ